MTVSRFRAILYTAVAIVAVAGLADATYLTVQALTGETLSCGGSPDCFRVLGSSYAKLSGIPVAILGALAYFTVFTLATFAAFGYSRAPRFLFLIAGAMFLMTLWLLYVQAFVTARVLPILFILSSNHIPYRGAADRRAALTTPIWRMSGMLV